jgi:hypothetical protein
MSIGIIIALVVFLIAFLGAIGVIASPVHLMLWLIAALALAVLVSGITFPFPWPRNP